MSLLKNLELEGEKKTDWRNSLIENYKTLSVVFPCKSEEWALCQVIDIRLWKTFSQKEERIRVTMKKKKTDSAFCWSLWHQMNMFEFNVAPSDVFRMTCWFKPCSAFLKRSTPCWILCTPKFYFPLVLCVILT